MRNNDTMTQKQSPLMQAVLKAVETSRKVDFAGKAPHSLNTKEQSRLTL
ncbi:hypothetical protein [Endozoicomonas arenosclerae]|nr:hypothetical protein [Endozoicomonas arenosclerae]